MTKPWEETWQIVDEHGEGVWSVVRDGERFSIDDGLCSEPETRKLVEAAPDAVRALIAVEWSATMVDGECGCAYCWCRRSGGQHAPDCALDAALRKAGFPTQAERDVVRDALTRSR